jgi:hypothetical protein
VKGNIQYRSISNTSHLVCIIYFKNIFRSYKFDIPTLEQQRPQVIAMTPIEATRMLYKIKQINNYLMSSFQVVKKLKFHYKIILLIVKITSISYTIALLILQGMKYI